MKKFLLLIIHTRTLAKEQITNLITLVSYFVNHEQQLKILDEYLSKYRQASIVGTSGIGKTQLIRMYSYQNKNNYNLIWFLIVTLILMNNLSN